MDKADIVNDIAEIICMKDRAVSPETCFGNNRLKNGICSNHDACRIQEKSIEQLMYIICPPHESIYLEACPGSGKTEVVGLKAAYEFARWNRSNGGIAVLTFTNNAADVIRERVSQFTGISKTHHPHFIGTIDSWVHGYVAQPFGWRVMEYKGCDGDKCIRIIDESSDQEWLSSLKCDSVNITKQGVPGQLFPNHFYYDDEKKDWVIRPRWGNAVDSTTATALYDSPQHKKYRESKGLSWLTKAKFIESFDSCKKKFYRHGFATYRDVESISSLLMQKTWIKNHIALRFPLVIVDECQDLSMEQINMLKNLMDAGSSVHLVGDLNQSIYGFKEVEPKNVKEFVENERFKTAKLRLNFRSCKEIVELCSKLVNSTDTLSKIPSRLVTPCIVVEYGPDELNKLPNIFEQMVGEEGIKLNDAVILARGRSTINRLSGKRSSSSWSNQILFAEAIGFWMQDNVSDKNHAMKSMGEFLSETLLSKVPCAKTSYFKPAYYKSTAEWRRLLAHILDTAILMPEINDLNLTWEKWSKAVREKLLNKVIAELTKTASGNEIKPYLFRVPKGCGKDIVRDMFSVSSTAINPELRVMTIHQAKGQTYESVMLVSSESAKGNKEGHWKSWVDGSLSEAVRMAYVASSRPRHMLVWAVPVLTDSDKLIMEALGFQHRPVTKN